MNLYPHQQEARVFLRDRRRAYLADEMRVGKTPPTIVAARDLGVERPVVLCPAIARDVWEQGWQQWGIGRPQVISYDQLVQDYDPEEKSSPLFTLIADHDPDLLILDEAHRLGHREAQRTKLGLKLANRAPRVWLLSGSPMPNHPGELYPFLRAVWPDELRRLEAETYMKFLNRFCRWVPTQYGIKVTGAKNVPELRGVLDRIMLRRRFTEVHEGVPPLRWEITPLNITLDTAVLGGLGDYELAEQAYADFLAGRNESAAIATVRRILGALKAEPAARLIDEELKERQYEKVVVLAYHRQVIEVLAPWLRQYNPAVVHGDTRDRAAQIKGFQTDPSCRVFIGQITAAGEAIDLSAAHHVVMVEQLWTPDGNRQAAFRVMNIGKDTPCYARMLVVPRTLDMDVQRVLQKKMEMQGDVFHS